jgi:predicted acylesterase/phospholipase RssA
MKGDKDVLINIDNSSKHPFKFRKFELYKCDIDELFDDVCFGFNSTDNIIFIMYMFLKKKNLKKNITFKDLYDMTKSKLIMTGTCINDASIHYFSVDSTPNMEVLKALRISISIPFFCKPCKYDNKVWIDGACINNYPIELYSDRLNDVIGILVDDNYNYIEEFEEVDKYILAVLKCICRGLWVNKYDIFKNQTIKLTTFYDTATSEFTNTMKKTLKG